MKTRFIVIFILLAGFFPAQIFAKCCPYDPTCKIGGDVSFCDSNGTFTGGSYWTQSGNPTHDDHNDGAVPTGWYGQKGTPPPNPEFQDSGVPNGRADYYTCLKNREACGETMSCFNKYSSCLHAVNPCLDPKDPNCPK